MSARKQGEILDGKYEILGRLGTGGMGEVYKVRHVHLEEQRVVKILRQDLATDPAAAQRFLHEARTATSIKHPNLAILYDFSKLADGSFYMVWENIEGEDLGKMLRERGPLPVALAVEMGIQGLQGLDALHSAGVIHRDISPDNLMITRTPKGQPLLKIIDLGLAKNLSANAPNFEITQAGMFLGKLRYCSPEQAGRGGEATVLDRRSDLYSFAAVFYEAICGLPPFDSESAHGFVLKRLTEEPLPLVSRNPKVQVSEELDAVIRRGLERDREARYPDAQTFIRALQRVAERLRGATTVEVRVPARPQGTAAPAGARPAAALPSVPGLDELLSTVTRPTSRPSTGTTGAIPKQPVMAASPAPAPATTPPPSGSTGELSRAERDDLMAQIDRAAKRAEETTSHLSLAADALKRGRIDEARTLVNQMKAANPRQKGLVDLESQVTDAEGRLERARQSKRTEEMLESYLKAGQPQLARFALETLLEVAPDHPRAAELQARVDGLSGEIEGKKQAQEALHAGRAAVVRGDLREARRQLDLLSRYDRSGTVVSELKAEIDGADRDRQRLNAADTHRQHLDQMLRSGRIDDASRELEQLAQLNVTKVTLDLYRQRIAEARRAAEENAQASSYEARARERAAAGDFGGARELALELEHLQPASPRPAALFSEIGRLQEDLRHRQGVEQGVRQLEGFLASSRFGEAELALKILVQMAPQHPRRKELERQVAALRPPPAR